MEVAISKIRSGMVDLMILGLLYKSDMYGYEMTKYFKNSTDGQLGMTEERIYIIMQNFEKNKYVSRYTVKVNERRKRHYYHLEDAGIAYFKEAINNYKAITKAASRLLDDIDFGTAEA